MQKEEEELGFNLYMVKRSVIDDYDRWFCFESFIVCSDTGENARFIHPRGNITYDTENGQWVCERGTGFEPEILTDGDQRLDRWVKSSRIKDLDVVFIGRASKSFQKGDIIMIGDVTYIR